MTRTSSRISKPAAPSKCFSSRSTRTIFTGLFTVEDISVPCLDVSLTLDAIYRRVELSAVGEPDAAEYDAAEFGG